ncbi:MAG: LuxR C-terminal-related transcriptional regulator [Myxococcota bacterium]|nr:LuxR C-terminal-related transcriptional regulator [Myxococcota bacterium]
MAPAFLEIQAVIDLIYEAAEGRGPWEPVLASMSRLLKADVGHHFRIDLQGTLLEAPSFHGVKEETISRYHEEFQGEDPRLLIARSNPGQVFSDVQVISPAQCFLRGPEQAPFQEEEVETFQLLLPHLRRALRLRGLLDCAERRGRDLQAALDEVGPPVAILDAQGRVLGVNAPAQRLLRAGDGVQVVNGKLTVQLPAAAAAFSVALKKAVRLSEPLSRPEARAVPGVVEVLREKDDALRLILMPLRDNHQLRGTGEPRARVLVVLQEAHSAPRLDPGLVGQLHQLTPTEALLAVALAQGKTVAEFAGTRGTSEHTVRTQLKSLLEKTGTQRQTDLVAVVLRSAGLGGRPPGQSGP